MLATLSAATLLALASAVPAAARELKVLTAEAPRDALEAVAARFAADVGCRVAFAFMTAGQVRERVQAGEAADLAISSPAVIAGLVKAGRVGGAVDLARIGLAVAVRAGAAAPDLSTPEAFTAALLAARSVAFTDPKAGGTAGTYFADLLQRLGIADVIATKAVYAQGGRDAAAKVASGEAEFAITFPSEIAPVKGAAVAGLFPTALQSFTTYVAAVPATSRNGEAARAYVRALTDPAARAAWTAAGFEPVR